MTKFTHKEYVETMIDMAEAELQNMKTKMKDIYKIMPESVEVERLWIRLSDEFKASLRPVVTELVLNKGIPRKQRVNDKNKPSLSEGSDRDIEKTSGNNKITFSEYCKQYRKKVRDENPTYDSKQITKCLSEMWKNKE
uniref:HMG box domain-containing protein n=1 Tax=viral metagenome TaxID=1070528 RepID=A0A6C0KHT9_9ZZZZ